MNANSAEATILRAQIASLRASLASVASFVQASERLISELECKVDQLENGNNDASDDALARVEANPASATSRTFPKEIFLEIGGYFGPGSRTLFNLASTCKDLFALLSPCLWEHLNSEQILDCSFNVCRKRNLKNLGQHVKNIDLFPVELSGNEGKTPALVNGTLKVLHACSRSLRVMTLNMEGLLQFPDQWEDMKLPNLEVLDLNEAPDVLPLNFARPIPNVRKLRVIQALKVERFQFEVWKGVGKLAKLEELTLRIAKNHARLATLPALLSKIKTFQPTWFTCFLALAAVPESRPTSIVWDWLDWPSFHAHEGVEDSFACKLWRAIAAMDSLKHFQVSYFHSELFRLFGFPRYLESLNVDHFLPLVRTNADVLEQVRAKIPKSLTDISIDSMFVIDCPEKDTLEWNELRDELCFWDSLNRRDHRMELDASPDTDEEEERIRDLEEEVWRHKTGSGRS